MPISWRCTLCGQCCKTYTPFVLPSDVARLARATGKTIWEFVTFYQVDEFPNPISADEERYVAQMDQGPVVMCLSRALSPEGEAQCVFLKENLCSVHLDRPLVCHSYPFQPVDLADIAGAFRLIDSPCFGRHAEDEIVNEAPLRANYHVFHGAQDEYLATVAAWNADAAPHIRDIESFLIYVGLGEELAAANAAPEPHAGAPDSTSGPQPGTSASGTRTRR